MPTPQSRSAALSFKSRLEKILRRGSGATIPDNQVVKDRMCFSSKNLLENEAETKSKQANIAAITGAVGKSPFCGDDIGARGHRKGVWTPLKPLFNIEVANSSFHSLFLRIA